MATLTPKEVSDFISKRVTSNTARVLRDTEAAKKAAEEARKTLDENLKENVDASLTKKSKGQKLFSQVFGYTPESIGDVPVTCYKPEDWDESVRGFIPKPSGTYVWPKAQLEDIVVAYELGENVYCSGPTGSGKSTLFKEYCAAVGRPFIRFNGREDTEAASIFGFMDVKDGSTRWHDGDYTTGFKHGALVLMDEATAIPAGIMMGLQWTLEPDGSLLLVDKPGTTADRLVTRDPRFRLAFADNTRGLGDSTGAHAGTNLMNTATLDRFGTSIYLGYLPVKDEVDMIHKAFPKVKESLITLVVKYGTLIRTSYASGDISLTVSPRALQNIVQKLAYHGDLQKAVGASYINKLEDPAEIDCARRHFETTFDTAFLN